MKPAHAAHAPIQLSRIKFILVFASMMVAIFLFALDQLILATAIPRIGQIDPRLRLDHFGRVLTTLCSLGQSPSSTRSPRWPG